MKKYPWKSNQSRTLGLVSMGIVWLILCAITIFRLSAGEAYGNSIAGVTVGVLAFGNALAFIVSGW